MTLVKRLRTTKDHFNPNDDLGWRPGALRIEAADRIEALEAELSRAREALEPFARKFGDRRAAYSRRYKDHALGEENFDKMPDGWAMDGIVFSMGVYRRAREVFRSISHKEG